MNILRLIIAHEVDTPGLVPQLRGSTLLKPEELNYITR